MLNFIATGLVVSGVGILVCSVFPIWKLMALLPREALRQSWYVLTALIMIFIIGYTAYIGVFWGAHERLANLVVPGIFFLGACFVLLVNYLSLKTTRDIQRMPVLEQESITDPLTELYNRRYLDRCLATEIDRANRYGISLSLLLLDIDHFKRINDSYGHQVGDVVLAELAQVIVNSVRTTDVVTRYGGEEIMVMAPSTPLETAVDLAARLRETIERESVDVPAKLHPELKELRITVSIGVASFQDGNDHETLIQSVDEALYRAKRNGRNCVSTVRPATTQP
ncbi:GGDEF domain-containing protein [Halomonas aquatica]|uniref:diguanylate cyclase n=1 Tax=Halomonas aquatica TaxID=3151123 RepID=A0ABV1NAL3_9GAMM